MPSKTKQKTIAGTLTAALLLVAYLVMNSSALPRRDFIAEHYDEINWTRFKPKRIRLTPPEENPQQVERKAEEIPAAPAIERIQLDDLLNDLDAGTLKMETRTVASPGKTPKKAGRERVSLDADDAAFSADFALRFNETSPLMRAARHRGRGSSRGAGLTVKADSGENTGQGLGTFNADAGADLRGPQALGKKGGAAVKIGMKKLEDFGEAYEDFSSIYRPLVEWLKRHPVDLPDVVKRFTNYQPGNLTSRVYFTDGSREFDMFLLCVEQTYEVKIVLLEKDEVTYLIDQGFRKRSNYLRTGMVDFLENREILKFGTNLQPAGSARTDAFYQIFLSWWESVKHEVEKK